MIVATIRITNDAAASGHMCQISPKAHIMLRSARIRPAGVFFGMWALVADLSLRLTLT